MSTWIRRRPATSSRSSGTFFPAKDKAIELFSPDFNRLTDEALQRIAGRSRAASTLHKYFYPWRKWVEACRAKGYTPLPAKSDEFTRYLVYLASNRRNASCVRDAISAVNFVHSLCDLPSPSQASTLPWGVADAVKREWAKPVKQAAPLETWMVAAILRRYCAEGGDLALWTVAIGILAGFVCFGRYDCITRLRLEPEFLRFAPDGSHARLFIDKRKTDQYHGGQFVDVAASPGSDICPVRLLQRYTQLVGAKGFLLRGKGPDAPMAYRDFIAAFRTALNLCCGIPRNLTETYADLSVDRYSTHSIRRGATTAALRNGASVRGVRKQAGVTGLHWEDRYEDPDLEARLSVTRALDIGSL